MGLVCAEIELINAGDLKMARRYIIGDEEVKCINVNILVDTGAYNLCINEFVQEQLCFLLKNARHNWPTDISKNTAWWGLLCLNPKTAVQFVMPWF